MTSPAPRTLQQLLTVGHDDSLAVADRHQRLTYRELRSRVAHTAGRLQARDVQVGDRVGVQLETSVETMIAAHAVLACGAVIVPLDPRAPRTHTARIVDDCSIDIVITPSDPVFSDPAFSDPSFPEATTSPPVVHVEVTPDHLAYIIFTSGSTGRPKGIAHTHASALAYAQLAVDTYQVTASDRITQVAAMHFDQSTFGLYSGPLAGAATLMVPEALLAFPASVAKIIADEAATIWYSVPTLIMRLLQRGALEQHDLSAMRWVKFGGEVFPPGQLRAAMQLFGNARFSNVYGPAEVNQCMYFHLDAAPTDDGPIAIGVAWPDTEVAIVDTERRLVPAGTEGELVVRSTTVMRGYWNHGELTAQSFCQVPELDVPDATRWYATGDLAVERPDGQLVFLGRIDNQVKVRGHRVEIEAVESALLELPDVTGAGVVVIRDDDGTTRLIGVLEGAPRLDLRSVRTQVAQTLPGYAVPDELVQHDALPRTGTGKVDRNVLRAELSPAHPADESE